jgi:hypothetical protein
LLTGIFYFFILISVLNIQIAFPETLNFEVNERKFGKSEVLVELIFSSKVDGKKSRHIMISSSDASSTINYSLMVAGSMAAGGRL